MKTPEEIKGWLEGCRDKSNCSWCPNSYQCDRDAYTLAYIQQLEARVPKWISVDERLPEDVEYVLCLYKDEFGGEWSTVGMKVQWGCGWDLDIDDGSGRNLTVTHWMPLPEPPEEEEHATDRCGCAAKRI